MDFSEADVSLHTNIKLCVAVSAVILNFSVTQLFFFPSGNGVVIHLPGLFEEAEKNESKGKGAWQVVALNTYSRITDRHTNKLCLIMWRLKSVFVCAFRSKRLGEEVDHLRQSTHWWVLPGPLLDSFICEWITCECMHAKVCVSVCALLSLRCVRVCVPSLPPSQCLTSTKQLMAFRNNRDKSKQARSKEPVA